MRNGRPSAALGLGSGKNWCQKEWTVKTSANLKTRDWNWPGAAVVGGEEKGKDVVVVVMLDENVPRQRNRVEKKEWS